MTDKPHALRLTLLALLAALLTLAPVALAQQDNGVRVEIFEMDDSFYPEVQVFFSAYNQGRGRALQVNQEMLSITVTGQPAEIINFEQMPTTNRPTHLAIVVDLTSSQNFTDFLDEQRRTAQSLIDALNPSDYVSLVTFDTNGTNVAYSMSLDHNGALNTLDGLEIVQGPSNKFRDGVYTAVQQLETIPDPTARKVTVVLTDVQEPEGAASVAETVSLANQLDSSIHIIGFNDADATTLDEYTSPTGGFTYLQRELEEELGGLARLAENVVSIITNEYVVRFKSPLDATDSPATMQLSVNTGGASGTTSLDITTRGRAINIAFPNIDPNAPVSDDVTFEPTITYADTGNPVTVTRAAYLLNGSNLNPADSSEISYTWDIADIAGGLYDITLEITDEVGNTAEGTTQVRVASPLTVSFSQPAASADPVDLEPGVQTIELAIDSDFPINEITLFVDNEPLETLQQPEEPYTFTWDTGNNAAGIFRLRVEASDVRGNNAQASQRVNLLIGTNTNNLLILLMLLVVSLLIVLAGAAFTISRRRAAAAAAAAPIADPVPVVVPDVGSGAAAPAVGGMPATVGPTLGTGGQLVVVRGGIGVPSYPLNDGRYLVGRGRGANIQVIGLNASREHAEVTVMNGQVTIRDLHPEKGNASRINGQTFNGRPYNLHEGDRIIIGDTELLYRRS